MIAKKLKKEVKGFGKGFKFKPWMIALFALVVGCFVSYIGYRLCTAEKRLIPISALAIIAGVLFESKRLSEKWSSLFWMALGSFVFSLVFFLPGKREYNYSFEHHIETWPYFFIIIFAFVSIAFHGDKVVTKLTEGITLLQSIAVIYWVVDYGFIQSENIFLESLMVLGLFFALFSLFHAFTHVVLSRTSRLTLSIWSALIMMLFAIDNIYRVYQNEQIENTADLTHGFYIGLQFFLLGVSAIYVIQNFLMLMGFFPGKGTFFNAQYFRDVRELKNDHINRYSDGQVHIMHSIFCVLFTGAIFAMNYYYQLLPRHLVIWIVFVIFPFILSLYDYLILRKSDRLKQA